MYDIDQLKQFMDSCQDCGITCLQLHVCEYLSYLTVLNRLFVSKN